MRIDGIQLAEGSSIKNATVANGAEFPTLPNEGELFYRTDTKLLYVYDGENWVANEPSVATSLATPRFINGQEFDGTQDVNITSSDVPEGTNKYFTTSRAASAAPVQTVFGRKGEIVLQSGDVTTALGFTPANTASPTFTGVVSGITKSMVGLANVDNTSDASKPISNAQQTALQLKAPIASPTFTGTVSGITKSMVGLSNVDNTSDLLKPISNATKSELDLKATTVYVNTEISDLLSTTLGGDTNFAATVFFALNNRIRVDEAQTFTAQQKTVAKTNIDLNNVNNTSDLAKPISTAQQTALNLKANLASPTFTGTVSGVTKAMVGLSNVDNTSDLLKPISTAQQTALNAKADVTYVDTKVSALVDTAPEALDTLNELAAALGDDPNFATTIAGSVGNRLRVDTNAQGLSAEQKTNAKTNIDLQNVENKTSATIRDEITSTNVAKALGYRPLLMGAGVNQLGNDVKIGWLTGTRLGLTVDVQNFGSTWPIDINGTASQLNGQNAAYYLNAANFTGTILDARLPATMTGKTFSSNITVSSIVNINGGTGEGRLNFSTTANSSIYLFNRNGDGAFGLHDLAAGLSPFIYTPSTKVFQFSSAINLKGNLIGDRSVVTDLDTLAGNRFFGFGGGGTNAAVGSPPAAGAYDAVGLQMDQAGQRTQLVLSGEAEGLMLRTDDTPDGTNGWGTWRQIFDSNNLKNLSQLNNDLTGNSAVDWNVKMLYASSGVVANGTNTLRMFGANTGVAPGIAAEGADSNVGIYYGTKGNGYHLFSVGNQHHFTIGGNPGTIVNRYRVYGGLAGQNAALIVEGGDTNIGMDFWAKGAGEFLYRSNGVIQFVITSTANAVNFPKVMAAPAGSGITFSAEGADTNINAHLRSKGSGAIALQSSTGGNAFVANAPTGSSNWIATTAAAAGQAPTIGPQGGDTNLDLVLLPKGAGSVRAMNTIATPGISITSASPVVHFFESDATGSAGVFRTVVDTGKWRVDMNTHTNRVFGTYKTPIEITSTGQVRLVQGTEDQVLIGSTSYGGSARLYVEGGTRSSGTIWGDTSIYSQWDKDGQVVLGTGSHGELELGKTGRLVAGTPYIDFHSAVNSGDYDVRIIASGGTAGVLAGGDLDILAKTLKHNGTTIATTTETLYAPVAGNTFTVNLNDGTFHKYTTSANTTITLPTSIAGKSFTVKVVYGGAHTVTFTGGTLLKWAGGVVPKPTSVNGKSDIYVFLQDGVETNAQDGGRNF